MSSERSGSRSRSLLVAVFVLAAAALAAALIAGALRSGPDEPPTAEPADAEDIRPGGPGEEGVPGVDRADSGLEPDAREGEGLGGGESESDAGTTGAEAPATAGGLADRPGREGTLRPESLARDEPEEPPAVDGHSTPTSPPPAPAAAGVGADEVERILARAERRYAELGSLRARFDQEIHNPLLDRHRTGTGTWYQKGRSRFKMDFEDPPDDVIVADGVHLWLYYPSTNPRQVIRQSLEADTRAAGTADVLAHILEEARSSYEASYGGLESVAGVATHRIDLRPVDRSPYRQVRVWIAQVDDLVRRFEIVEQSETVRTVTLRELEPNAEIPDGVFRFVPPADADVFAG